MFVVAADMEVVFWRFYIKVAEKHIEIAKEIEGQFCH